MCEIKLRFSIIQRLPSLCWKVVFVFLILIFIKKRIKFILRYNWFISSVRSVRFWELFYILHFCIRNIIFAVYITLLNYKLSILLMQRHYHALFGILRINHFFIYLIIYYIIFKLIYILIRSDYILLVKVYFNSAWIFKNNWKVIVVTHFYFHYHI